MTRIIRPKTRILEPKSQMGLRGFICARLTNIYTGQIKIILGRNLVTNDGDVYYARKSVGEAPTEEFKDGGLKLGSGTPTPGKTDSDVQTYLSATYKAVASGYPKTDDDDVNNTYYGNDDYVTWKYSYGSGEANYSNINEGAIVDQESSPNEALCHFVFSSTINKTASYTLDVWVNHEYLGGT